MKDAFDDVIFEKANKEELLLPHSYEERIKSTLQKLPEKEENRYRVFFTRQTRLVFGAICAICVICMGIILYEMNFSNSQKRTGEIETVTTQTQQTGIENYAASKEETQTEEVQKILEDGQRETILLPRLAYDDWVSPIKNNYFQTFSEAQVDGKIIYMATFAGSKGDEIYAVSDGTIEECEFAIPYGNYVILVAENGAKVRYSHLLDFQVKAGDTVKQGDVIATMGASGMVTGPALGLSVTVDGESIKPVITTEEYGKPRVFDSEE